jgi:2-polyprenyl-3-methyl-5-hydroxy-6-metoxy-1,4-benzoquinol methylase
MTNRTIKFWNKVSANYDVSVYDKYKPVYDETVALARKYLDKGDHVLDFACGTGSVTFQLSVSVKQILGIDISDQMIAVANKKAAEQQIENVEFRSISIFDPGLQPGSFDVIVAFNILQFIKDENDLLQRIKQLLSEKGIFIQATDCHSEYKSYKVLIMKTLSKLGYFPYIRSWTIKELEQSLANNHFEILETSLLYEMPVNYFIVAKKQD